MIELSIVVTYYNSPDALRNHLEALSMLDKSSKSSIELVIVDDGSQDAPAFDVVENFGPVDFNLRLFRLVEDIPWNHRSARNIGAHEAKNEHLLLLDIDTVIIPDLIQKALVGVDFSDRAFYMLPRRDAITGEVLKVHHDSLLIPKALFWEIGGYDENFAGYWGAGPFWLRRAEVAAQKRALKHTVFLDWIGEKTADSQAKFRRKNNLIRRLRIRTLRFLLGLGIIRRKQLTYSYEIGDNGNS